MMRRLEHRHQYLWLLAVLIGVALVVIGAVEIYVSRGLPAFVDKEAVDALRLEGPPKDRDSRHAFFGSWHERRWALEGGRFILIDQGLFDLTAGLLLIGSALLVPRAARTYGRRRLLLEVAIGATSMVGIAAASVYGALLDYDRDRLNIFADSLSIPIMRAKTHLPFSLLLIVGIITLVSALLRRRKQALWPAVPTRRRRMLIGSLVFLPLIALLLVSAVEDRPYSASWISLIARVGLAIVLASWLQSALTPPGQSETVAPEALRLTG